ncbi:MAG: endonuclease/exonuclease/phosphatase family protein [Chitinophagaceae bacterium]
MAFSFRKFSKRFFILANVVLIVVLLIGGTLPYLGNSNWPWLGFIALAFPYLLLCVMGFLIFWLIAKPKIALLPLMAILFCWKQVAVTFRLNKSGFDYRKNESSLRVMTWNVKIFEGLVKGTSASAEAKNEILSFIKASVPDVVCLQEFSQYDSAGKDNNHIQRMMDAGYPYYIFSGDYEKASVDYHSGVAIFSKLPLITHQKVPFASNRESIVYADLVKGTDTFRVFTTHLQSFKFSKDDYRNIEVIKARGDVATEQSKNLISKMKHGFELRAMQAQQIRPLLDSCPYPEIICGDFNDVPNSYTYWQIRGSRRDAFMEKGTGIGRTFISLAPTLRIDYIMCDNRLKVEQFITADKRFSDHLPLIADMQMDKK